MQVKKWASAKTASVGIGTGLGPCAPYFASSKSVSFFEYTLSSCR